MSRISEIDLHFHETALQKVYRRVAYRFDPKYYSLRTEVRNSDYGPYGDVIELMIEKIELVEKLKPVKVSEYPASWWDHFKQYWFPAWFKKRFPVKMNEVIVVGEAVYPNYRPAIRDEDHYIRIASYEPATSY